MRTPTTIEIHWGDHPLVTGCAPEWAESWGQDRRGVWVAFEFQGARQRMRWIPGGRFDMGSPEGEPGRRDNEGPVHSVLLTEGFWLFDTPCTQRLWEVVMGENPSRFRSSDRPVEQVSWEEVQEFLGRVNERVPGVNLELPTEAQWEFACRAGEPGAIYTGELEILGSNNAPLLDPIAWYAGNCGVGFDLEDGWDTSDWPEKQFDHEKGGTHPVGKKEPNKWGCYDMLGNVWEWCADWYGDYDGKDSEDPSGPAEGVVRVVRGGSWFVLARNVRSACRYRSGPGYRDFSLGFRAARVQHPGG